MLGVGGGQPVGHGPGDGDHVYRIEPHVGVERLVVALGAGVDQRHDVGDVELGVVGQLGLRDRLVDAGLERPLVDQQVGLAHLGHLLGRELDVVRLDAGAGQAVDVHAVTRDALGNECERVRGGDDRHPGVRSVRVTHEAAAAQQQRADDPTGDERDPVHENDCHWIRESLSSRAHSAYAGGMLVVTRYRVDDGDAEGFSRDAEAAMEVLAERPGFVGAWLGRNTDERDLWTLTLLWHDVRSYRRALSAYDVKVSAVPLLSRAVNEPSAYEVVGRWQAGADPGGSLGGS